MLVTVLLGAPAWLAPAAPVALLPVRPEDAVAPVLGSMPVVLPVPGPAMLPLPAAPLVLPVPAVAAMLPELVSAVLALVAMESLVLAVAPLVRPSVALLPDISLLVSVVPHAASPRASKHAKSTLCSLRFMINSFGWVFFRLCVTMPRATSVRGLFLNDVQDVPVANEADQRRARLTQLCVA